jgi:hypothetical protein
MARRFAHSSFMRQLVGPKGDPIELPGFTGSRVDLVLSLSLELFDGVTLVVRHVGFTVRD